MSDEQGERDAADTSTECDTQSDALHGEARHVGNSRPQWRAVPSFPDLCNVGNSIVGFDSMAAICNPVSYSLNVITGGERTYRVGDISQGTEGNAGAGVASGTSQASGHVIFLTGQDNLKVNGLPIVRDGSECRVNCNSAGVGGTKGYICTDTQAVNSRPEASEEPLSTAASLQQQARANLERVGELRDALSEDPNGKTAAEAQGLFDEVQQLVSETTVQQEAVKEAHQAGGFSGNELVETLAWVDEAANRASDLQHEEATRQVQHASEVGRKTREAGVFVAEAATPYGTWVDIQDTIQLWGEGRYLAASGMTALTAVSVIPGVGLIRKGESAIDAVRTTDRTVDAAEDANRSRPSGSNDGTRVEQNSRGVEGESDVPDSGNSDLPLGIGGTGANYDRINGQGLYVLRDNEDTVRYIGRGDAPARLRKHANTFEKSVLDHEVVWTNNLHKDMAKGLEQRLMDHFGGARSQNQNTSIMNRIRSYSLNNPNASRYRDAVSEDLWEETLRRIRQ